jgi:REP element-mobilizing transposase RayT
MPKTLGYMLTWTTYGTWLQGDKRGYVKKGQTFPADGQLFRANKEVQANETVRLSPQQKRLVRDAIINEAKVLGQRIFALAVCSSHVHLVGEYIPKPIADIVAYYKKAGRLALKENGTDGKVWTKGYDTRYCFDQKTLQREIRYVLNHISTKYLAPGFTGG